MRTGALRLAFTFAKACKYILCSKLSQFSGYRNGGKQGVKKIRKKSKKYFSLL
jgi:hypothetical protein